MTQYALALIVASAFTALYLLLTWHRYMSLRRQVGQAFLSIEAHLQRRYEVIPHIAYGLMNLMPTGNPEGRESLHMLLAALDRAIFSMSEVMHHPGDGQTMHRLLVAEAALGAELGLLIAIAQRADVSIADPTLAVFRNQLAAAESQIELCRRDFDYVVEDFNEFIDMFPNNLLRRWLGVPHAEPFRIQLREARTPVYITYQ